MKKWYLNTIYTIWLELLSIKENSNLLKNSLVSITLTFDIDERHVDFAIEEKKVIIDVFGPSHYVAPTK